ncbi:prepilin-type N-terminal cleavage/methylation domain-containing protein [Amphibacillus sp. MSJ-3]|uniref:competence type IV pilus minor pilin ComGF n=1 Tax=Amphibacillus sp. MSJ-3 TaxID=2841505 RepID=UPI001C0EE52E|nr:competence type IV pilus minor pilin ComGF [Amphibacillus sp. MSJ-3]MBU5594774.1 prepilin-type N-terminal cleavage/methylation domain-containing protein [Amphibacillus sp. MSJ-3]
MQKKRRMRRLFISSQSNEHGFTLIEMLISFSILSFLLLITPTIWTYLNYQPQTERFSVHQFFHVITDEVQLYQVLGDSHDSLSLQTIDQKHILISKYKDTIRRQVNRAGHEVLMRDVQSFEVKYFDHYLVIKLRLKSGNLYEKVITKFNK